MNDRIIEQGNIDYVNPICNNCKNHIEGIKCKAFDFIPNIILLGENSHKLPLIDQDNDIVFEPIDSDE